MKRRTFVRLGAVAGLTAVAVPAFLLNQEPAKPKIVNKLIAFGDNEFDVLEPSYTNDGIYYVFDLEHNQAMVRVNDFRGYNGTYWFHTSRMPIEDCADPIQNIFNRTKAASNGKLHALWRVTDFDHIENGRPALIVVDPNVPTKAMVINTTQPGRIFEGSIVDPNTLPDDLYKEYQDKAGQYPPPRIIKPTTIAAAPN